MSKLTSFLAGAAAGAAGAVLYWKNKDKINPMLEQGVAKAMSLGENALDAAGKAKDKVLDLAGQARDGAADFTSRAKDGAADMAAKAKNDFTEFAQESRDNAKEIMDNARRIKAEKYDKPATPPPAATAPTEASQTQTTASPFNTPDEPPYGQS